MNGIFPEDSAERKKYPVYSGFLQYFPSAIAAIARHSYEGNLKHNPGQPLHHDRAKSDDEADALVRHLMEGDLVGEAWRSMSLLQKHLEARGAPIAPAARNAIKPELVPEGLAKLMLRDGVVVAPEVIPLSEVRGYNPPPNCDGLPFEPPYGDED